MLSLNGKVGLRSIALTSALLGVVIIVLSQTHAVIGRVAMLTLRPAKAYFENAVEDIRVLLTKVEDIGYDVPPENPVESSAIVHMKVEHPRSSFTDTSFFVRASGLTLSVDAAPNDHDWNEASIRSLLGSGCLGLSLSVPGSEVSPNGVAPLRGGVAEWIVRPAHSGSYKALIQIVETPCDERSLAISKKVARQEHRFEFINQPSSFSFDVTDRLLTREKLLSWLGGFFGAFLTLPGLIAFIEAQREKRRKRIDKAQSAG